MLARLLYRDGLMLVVDKPAGLPVHRGPKGGDAFEDYFDALRFGLPRPPALAHRLDRDTTGCLVLGRHRKALALLGKLFKQGKVGKCYWAVVENGPQTDEGRIDIPLARRDEARGWWMKPDPHGLPSASTWKVMGRGGGFSWLALEPLTGRTHQLRVHCAEMGWPIVGDNIYGGAPAHRRPAAASSFARGDGADFKKQGAGHRDRPGAGAHARKTRGLRLHSVKLRLDALRRLAVVGLPAQLALTEFGMIVPVEGKLLRSILVASSHSLERTIAFEQWKKMLSM